MNLSETHTFQTNESRVFVSVRVYLISLLYLQMKMLVNNYKLSKNVYSWYVIIFEELCCSLLMALQPLFCFSWKVNLSFPHGQAKVKCEGIWWECKMSYFSLLMCNLLYLFDA